MANTKSAAKRSRVSQRRRSVNRSAASKAKTAIRRAVSPKETDDDKTKAESLRKAYSAIDKASKTGAIHKNKAARQKSRLTKAVASK